ncbi:MAG TPA: MFS transporter [Pirellulales bacterium]|nr:MFS transporter [Pirellulales bacterium]
MGSVRARLCAMMFLQYYTWGSWGVELGNYMDKVLGFTGVQIGSVYSTTAIAAMITPLFMGYIADRLFATEKILGVLHLIGAALLGAAAFSGPILERFSSLGSQFNVLYGVMIVYALCFMPTLALTNSISFENIKDPEKEFPLIRVFGTLGWIAAGLVVGFFLKARPGSAVYDSFNKVLPGDTLFASNNFIAMAAACSLLLGLFCFTLPHTPPKKADAAEARGERKNILRLLADPSFLIFTVASFLICIPLAFYYAFANVFLNDINAPWPTALQTVGQASEVFFMAAMPLFISLLGVKRMLAVGMLAWVARYWCFGTLDMPLVVLGLVLHGICYDFFFVASQIYVDAKADATQRASAQSFIAFVTLGLGMFVGAYAAGYVRDQYPPVYMITIVDEKGEPRMDEKGNLMQANLPVWDPSGKTGFARSLGLDSEKTIAVGQVPSPFVDPDAKLIYDQKAVEGALMRIDSRGDKDGQVSYSEWRRGRAGQWYDIWLWPQAGASLTLIFFWFGFRQRITPAQTAEMIEEAPLGAGEGPEPQVG